MKWENPKSQIPRPKYDPQITRIYANVSVGRLADIVISKTDPLKGIRWLEKRFMAIPDYQSLMLPLLRFASDEKEHSLRDTVEALAKEYNLTDTDLAEMLPSGRKARFYDRVGWATTYLRKAGLINSPTRGRFQISKRGLEILKNPPDRITVDFLEQFDEFVQFRARREEKGEDIPLPEVEPQTPEEAIEAAYQNLRQSLADEILQTIKNCSPSFFERLVVDVLVKMGYGGTRKDAGKAIGKSGDDGIDGIINEDRLGLDVFTFRQRNGIVP